MISVRSEAKQQNEIVYKHKHTYTLTHDYTRNKNDMNKTKMEVKTKKNNPDLLQTNSSIKKVTPLKPKHTRARCFLDRLFEISIKKLRRA